MKYYLFVGTPASILILLLSGCFHDRYISRSYSLSTGMTWQSFEFYSDSTFRYSEGGCVYSSEITGTYILNRNMLTLNKDTSNSYRSFFSHLPVNSDSCSISLTILAPVDTTNPVRVGDAILTGRFPEFKIDSIYPASSALIVFKSTADTVWRKLFVADVEGKLNAVIHRSYFPLTINIYYAGYSPANIIVNEPSKIADTLYLSFRPAIFLQFCNTFPLDYRINKMNYRKLDLARIEKCSPDCKECESSQRIILTRRKK
ncbi:MAG: hypothetical protein IM638_17515 [Bacteroidetes bacterium]|nr:hypothetical protein [Bacteroidota bacterium]